jgi:hypothetical protein
VSVELARHDARAVGPSHHGLELDGAGVVERGEEVAVPGVDDVEVEPAVELEVREGARLAAGLLP